MEMIPKKKRILITVRAYPQPSGKYAETSCVAGIDLDEQKPIRLYPIPARSLPDNNRFRKYNVIEARVVKASSDARPESHNIDLDSITTVGKIESKRTWTERNVLVEPFRVARSVEELKARFEEVRQSSTTPSLALIRPREVIDLRIRKKSQHDWTSDELSKLNGAGQQSFFGQAGFGGQSTTAPLQFIPYKFTYRFLCDDPNCGKPHEFEVLDWEITESYRRWRNDYGEEEWERAFRATYEERFVKSGKVDLQFFLGTIADHPQTWTIIGLYYPTRPS